MYNSLIYNLKNSNSIALVIDDISYKYAELYRYVLKYSYYLKQINGFQTISIYANNDIETYGLLIATILSEHAYLVLNASNPHDRNELIVDEAHSIYIFSSKDNDLSFFDDNYSKINLNNIHNATVDYELTMPEVERLAYVLFTSGSTGTPKGVQISKENLKALYNSFQHLKCAFCPEDQVLQMFDLTFDGSVLMLFLPLSVGATVYTVNPKKMKYLEIARLLTTYDLTYVFLVPSVIMMLKPYLNEIRLPSVKTFIMGAESVTVEMVELIKPSIPNSTLWNLYGPTEATVCVLAYEINDSYSEEAYHGIVPIGKPMKDVSCLIVDDGCIVKDVEKKGELYVSSPQLSKGYINNDQANSASFKYFDPSRKTKLFYATGDLVYLNELGNYVFCGRRDYQIKIQGYRIELHEIEHHASHYCQCACIAMGFEGVSGTEIILFIESINISENGLKDYLSANLPPYMVPKNICFIDSFPLTDSDKIDRKCLLNNWAKNETN